MQTLELILEPELAALAVGRFRTRPLLSDGSRRIPRSLSEPTTWTDAVEAVGVPHCEIGRILCLRSGVELAGDSATQDGDRVRIEAAPRRPLEPARLLCDSHLGKLARTLRFLGLDTSWQPAWKVDDLIRTALQQDRVVLSRGRALLKRKGIERAQLIRSNTPGDQVEEVLQRWRWTGPATGFGRCSLCNGLLQPVERARIESRIPPKTARWLDEYYLCGRCDQLYWHGTHFLALRRRLAPLLTGTDPEPEDPTEAH